MESVQAEIYSVYGEWPWYLSFPAQTNCYLISSNRSHGNNFKTTLYKSELPLESQSVYVEKCYLILRVTTTLQSEGSFTRGHPAARYITTLLLLIQTTSLHLIGNEWKVVGLRETFLRVKRTLLKLPLGTSLIQTLPRKEFSLRKSMHRRLLS